MNNLAIFHQTDRFSICMSYIFKGNGLIYLHKFRLHFSLQLFKFLMNKSL